MATRLEIAVRKLERLENERDSEYRKGKEEFSKIPFGQPNIIGRGDIYKDVKRHQNKAISLNEEIENQKKRVTMLKQQEYNKKNHLTKNGGLQTSVHNIEALKKRIAEREQDIAEGNTHNYTKAYLRKDKKKLAELLELKEKSEKSESILSDKSRELIDSGLVRQWTKRPIYYFVDELQKVAFEIDDNGNFVVSSRYPVKTEKDKKVVERLLKM